MDSEPFVLSNVDRAHDWVRACVESCSFPAQQSAALLAALCGFANWDVMIFAIENLPPSECDEAVGDEVASARMHRYFLVLVEDQELPPPVAVAISQQLSPSSNKQYVPFDLHAAVAAFDEDHHQAFDIDELFGAPPCPERMETIYPLGAQVDSAPWQEVMSFLGWDWEEAPVESEAFGEPSFLLLDANEITMRVPVYVNLGLTPPTFHGGLSDNETVRLLQFACLGNFISEWAPLGATDFLILASKPQLKTYRGKRYCFIGLAYSAEDMRWTDLLINRKCRDVSTLLTMNKKISSLRKGASRLAEPDDEFLAEITLRLSGFDEDLDDAMDWCFIGMPTDDGWLVARAVEDGLYDYDDLDPYMLFDLNEALF